MLNRLLAPIANLRRRGEVSELLQKCQGKVHLGCNDIAVPGYVNIDVRPTSATDIVHDCKDLSIFGSASLSFVFSNAFFEHLYLLERLPFLKDLHRVLRPEGKVVFTGLPDFEGVARAYLERRKPGNTSPEFDLYEAYRYTHGAPEGRASWWLAQLHKGLLDTRTLNALLSQAGFSSATVFRYCCGSEPNAVTIGFVAQKEVTHGSVSASDLQILLENLPTNVKWESLEICHE